MAQYIEDAPLIGTWIRQFGLKTKQAIDFSSASSIKLSNSVSLTGTVANPSIITLFAPNGVDYSDWTYDGSNMEIEVSKGDLNIRSGLVGGALGNVNVWSLLGNTTFKVGNQNFTQAITLQHDGTNGILDVTNHNLKINATNIGFYGVTPIARPLLATGAGHSVDDVITVLQNLGLARQS